MKLIRRAGQQPKALSDYSQDDADDDCTVMLEFHPSEELQSTPGICNAARGLFLDSWELYSCFYAQIPERCRVDDTSEV